MHRQFVRIDTAWCLINQPNQILLGPTLVWPQRKIWWCDDPPTPYFNFLGSSPRNRIEKYCSTRFWREILHFFHVQYMIIITDETIQQHKNIFVFVYGDCGSGIEPESCYWKVAGLIHASVLAWDTEPWNCSWCAGQRLVWQIPLPSVYELL